jgi:hypothetical protein
MKNHSEEYGKTRETFSQETVSQFRRQGMSEEASAGEEGLRGSQACFRRKTADSEDMENIEGSGPPLSMEEPPP